jgi:nucleoside-diphosphate-sugar epimerase
MVTESLSDTIIDRDAPVLVTGAAGFIGKSVVRNLLKTGFRNVRCLVRSVSKASDLFALSLSRDAALQIEVIRGNLLSRDDCMAAARGVTVIYHLAASTGEKSFPDAFMNSALATRNLIEAFLQNGRPKRFVNVSSFAVYSNLSLRRGAVLDETCPLEDSPQQRFDPYAFGKLKQEEIVKKYGTEHDLPYVIVRPGAVFGPGKEALTGRIGINTFGFFMHIGGSNQLPLTFVDNCADAIVLAGLKRGVDGEVFNIVDDELITSSEFLAAYKRAVGRSFSLRVFYPVAYLASWAWENYSKWSKGQLPPVFNRRRCSAEWKSNRFSNAKIRQRLGWRPHVPMKEALESFLSQFGAMRATR